jgi:hypothetical protein
LAARAFLEDLMLGQVYTATRDIEEPRPGEAQRLLSMPVDQWSEASVLMTTAE